jgi:osmoprotectant transport system substrate-binding protein
MGANHKLRRALCGMGERAHSEPFMSSMRNSLAAVLIGLFLTGAARADVVVSSKIDTEGSVLGNIILLSLQANGVKSRDRIELGATPVLRAAILAGEIDIYPEYTGNAAFFFNKAGDPVWMDAAAGYEAARSLDYAANKIVWLKPSPADNAWAIALRKDVAGTNGLRTLGDFGRWATGGGQVVLAASAEFVNSASALPAFQAAYGFRLTSNQLVILSGGDTAATIKAAAAQTSGVNAAMVYSSDGAIEASGLVLLADEKHVQPVYAPTPIVREKALQANPAIAGVLAPVFASLDLDALKSLNAQVQVEGRSAKDVASTWLKTKGFVK